MCNGLSCCSTKNIFQDKVCITWQVNTTGVITIYTNNIASIVSATGYVKNDTGTDIIVVNFLRGGTVIDTLNVPPQSSVGFSEKLFDEIQVDTTGLPGSVEGEFCITVRYSM
ncbi:DUF3992 domain-containing protein [Bacillus sp. AFS017336]|uniref:DUF3992 domain-containing protein n=1 Tax=Bacillus sp. AFS017336 TaxID=2033489 RepID=UPI000BF0D945|nr:S-Ena type endospore appendage [Bacillus sp. AFS017336]PEL06748.1 hypothetical protein CN601_20695 [Bacillus sp. AFS017336]